MRYLAIALLATLPLAAPALAQDVSADTRRDMWCALAFGIVAKDVPPDATADQLAVVNRYVEGAKGLRSRAEVALLESGFSDFALTSYVEALELEITGQLSTTDKPAEFSFEDCAALLGL